MEHQVGNLIQVETDPGKAWSDGGKSTAPAMAHPPLPARVVDGPSEQWPDRDEEGYLGE